MAIVKAEIRKATKNDFFELNDEPKFGTVFFLMNSNGEIEQQPYYFTHHTDKADFKKWYVNKQLYVFSRPYEEMEIIEE